MIPLLLVCLIFYLIGSFPTAYILVRLKYNKSITKEGSGNVGARNTLDVTNSKLDAAIVLTVDFLKGLLPVIWYLKYSGLEPELVVFPAMFLLVGHNYSLWLKFKGGRGLATGAGIMVAVNFTLVILWLAFYFALNKIIKSVHVSSVIALILVPLSVVFLQSIILRFNNSSLLGIGNQFQFLFSFCSVICIIILIKHISPMLDIIKGKK